ncbi:MAG: hypothetical protein KC713_06135 [Candidatus Omnitrophica bacterium]|nr:hypothetical protein [Candidatus Omnitrophota bacterium]
MQYGFLPFTQGLAIGLLFTKFPLGSLCRSFQGHTKVYFDAMTSKEKSDDEKEQLSRKMAGVFFQLFLKCAVLMGLTFAIIFLPYTFWRLHWEDVLQIFLTIPYLATFCGSMALSSYFIKKVSRGV